MELKMESGIVPLYALITHESHRTLELIQVTACYMEWNLLPKSDYEARIEFTWQRAISANLHINSGASAYLDLIEDCMILAREKIGFYPLMVLEDRHAEQA